MERTLEMSFARGQIFDQLFGDRDSFHLFTCMSTLITVIQRMTGKSWLTDPETSAHVHAALIASLQGITRLSAKETISSVYRAKNQYWRDNAAMLVSQALGLTYEESLHRVNSPVDRLLNDRDMNEDELEEIRKDIDKQERSRDSK